jgi:hypothetical protein
MSDREDAQRLRSMTDRVPYHGARRAPANLSRGQLPMQPDTTFVYAEENTRPRQPPFESYDRISSDSSQHRVDCVADKAMQPRALGDFEAACDLKQECFRQAGLKQDDSHHTSNHSDAKMKRLHPPTQATQEIFLEVAPGAKEKLRLSHETIKAIETGFFSPAVCWGCHAGLYCISDAVFLLCPDCTVISPLDESLPCAHGIGMGFTKDTLIQVKKELARKDHVTTYGSTPLPRFVKPMN